ncbi:rCG22807 [Rattus norvegicus]|uniref:Prostate and testis expressed 6 like n=2 Tax=Rattus norvegicus TaxID=10116 RepID=D4AE30_RAT|nr:rCG22807-like precursor [Rattus norvegicus]ADX68808.1 prostate and testis expressed C [Rattus norvegicus]EDL83260.1 rCG22807 [Rattus norvegicus]|eukprot:NP_001247412.1 uncharacterized protein LOC100361828 precursor [Rattus norvegicus]
MENLLKLCLFLLCFETGFPVQCVKCNSYKNGKCAGSQQTCTTRAGEMCMIRRTWYASEINKLLHAETTCMGSCKIEEKTSGYLTIHTYCCDFTDFCNDIGFPIVMT